MSTSGACVVCGTPLAGCWRRSSATADDYFCSDRCLEIGKLRRANAGLVAERDRLREALRRIRDECGRVCDNYEICEHRACASSYAAWAIADSALDDPPGGTQARHQNQ